MKFYVGVDYHKNYLISTVVDEKGRIIEQRRINNEKAEIIDYFSKFPKGTKIAVEASGNWYVFYEILESLGLEMKLVHPLKTKAIASAKIKSDKIDSNILAQLLRMDFLPLAYIPPQEIRDQRELLRYRASLVRLRTSIKNKIRATLAKIGIKIYFSDILGKRAQMELMRLEARPVYKMAIYGYLRTGVMLNEIINEVEKEIRRIAKENIQVNILISISGISYFSALLIISEIGDINRFPSARHLCSYAGLVPCVWSSGGKTRYGNITKQGSKWLRWILIEIAPHIVKKDYRFKALYERVKKTHGKKTAKVAVARKLLEVIYVMLKKNEPFKQISWSPSGCHSA